MSTAAFAVEFSFAPVAKVAEVGNGFFAYTAEGEAVGISALQYTQMKDAAGYYILDVDGKKVAVAGDEFVVEKLTVDSVGLDGSQPKVFFTNGKAKTFTKSDWLKAIKGQTVRRVALNTPTWEYENYTALKEGDVISHKKEPKKKVAPVVAVPAPVAPAPVVSAPVVSAPVAPAPVEASAPVAAPAQQSSGNGGISFRITH